MSAIWKNHASKLCEYMNGDNETQAHMYLEQLMLFPVDVQDRIIEDISRLSMCNRDEVAAIINRYSMSELK